MTKEEIEQLRVLLGKLLEMYDKFGLWPRLGEVDRMLAGIQEYETDLVRYAKKKD